MRPANQIRIVLDTSQILRAKALIYFVNETEETVNIVMENTPKIAKERSRPVEPMLRK